MKSALRIKKKYSIKKKYKAFVTTVTHMFPEINWNKCRFKFLPKGKLKEVTKINK